MELTRLLTRATALLLNGAYQGAESLIERAMAEAEELKSELAELDTLRTRVTEMAAEVDRLQSVIDEANAQEPYRYIGNGKTLAYPNPVYENDAEWVPVYLRTVPAQQSPAVAVTDEKTNFCALKSITDSQVNAVARAFWRRIYAYRNDYGIELPKPLPVEFMAHMATALTWVDREPSPRITEQDARIIGLSAFRHLSKYGGRTVDTWIEEDGSALLNKLNGDKNGK